MQLSSLEQRSLQRLEGFWKVVYHGSLHDCVAKEKSPRLSVFFGKLANQVAPSTPADFKTVGRPIEIPVPVGELMRLPINVVVNDCRLAIDPKVPLPSEGIGDFDVELEAPNIRLIDRFALSEDGEFLIPLREGKTPEQGDVNAKSYYIAIQAYGNPYYLMIPCSEVFRFFYCTSSRMANTILSTKILDPNRYIINPAHTNVDKKNPRVAAVWLRQWMLNQDRRHIARLFFTPGAFEEAANIFLRAAGRCSEDGQRFERALIAFPPAHGRMNLKLIYRTHMVDGHVSHFVTRILRSDWAMNFDAIHYGRDNDNERVASDEEREDLEEQSRLGPPAVPKVGTEITSLVDEGADAAITQMELLDADFAARFPELEKIPSPKIPKQEQTSKGSDDRRRVVVEGGSLLEFCEKTEKKVVSTVLVATNKGDEIKQLRDAEEPPQPLVDVPLAPETKLDEIIRLLDEAERKREVIVQYLPVLKDRVRYRSRILNRLPRKHEGKAPKWLFLNAERKETRLVLVAALRHKGQLRYLIDFMHPKDASGSSMLVLWDPEGLPLPMASLRLAIEGCISNISVSLKDCVLLGPCCGFRLSHSEGTRVSYQSLLYKIFEYAKDEMPLLIDPILRKAKHKQD